MKITIDLDGFKRQIAAQAEVIRAATRPAAQAAAQVIYEQARLNAPQSEAAHIFYGKNSKKTGQKYLFYPGDLKKSIYQAFSKSQSGPNLATYQISWNPRKAPYGWMVELGTSRAPAHPFMRPAIAARSAEALEAMRREFTLRVGTS